MNSQEFHKLLRLIGLRVLYGHGDCSEYLNRIEAEGNPRQVARANEVFSSAWDSKYGPCSNVGVRND